MGQVRAMDADVGLSGMVHYSIKLLSFTPAVPRTGSLQPLQPMPHDGSDLSPLGGFSSSALFLSIDERTGTLRLVHPLTEGDMGVYRFALGARDSCMFFFIWLLVACNYTILRIYY